MITKLAWLIMKYSHLFISFLSMNMVREVWNLDFRACCVSVIQLPVSLLNNKGCFFGGKTTALVRVNKKAEDIALKLVKL